MRRGKEKEPAGSTSADKALFDLGTWLGRHQALGMVANRCSAADAECLRSIRHGGQYKKLGMTWERFCSERAGISRAQADRLIRQLEEFGANYFRLAEVMDVSPETYRLIAGSVSDAGIQVDGETVAICPGNRDKIAIVVESARKRAKLKLDHADRPSGLAMLRKLLADFVGGAKSAGQTAAERADLILLLREGARQMETLSEEVRRSTFVLR
jgi:hypothetical protein